MSNGVDYEMALLGAIVTHGDIRTPIKRKITLDFFGSSANRAAFSYLLKWYNEPQYGDTPSWETFSGRFPQFSEYSPVEDSIAALCDQVRANKLHSDLADTIQDIGNKAMGDPLAGFEALKAHTNRLALMHTVDDSADVRGALDGFLEEYERMKNMVEGEKLKGKPYPWPALNKATLGIQDGQLIVLYGRPKKGKTFALLEILRCLHSAGGIPHVFSQELSKEEFITRVVAMSCMLDLNRLSRGELNAEEEQEMHEGIEAFRKAPPFVVDQLTSSGDGILQEMQAKVQESGATCVAIDAANTLGIDVKELVAVTRGLKRYARMEGKPVIITTQRLRPQGKGRGAEDGRDVYGSDSYLQDCDLLLAIDRDEGHRKRREQEHTVAAIRNGLFTKYIINYSLCADMTQKAELGLSDEEEAELEGDGQEDGRE